MAMSDPSMILDDVVDEASFLAFLESLGADFAAGAAGWENDRIDTMIEAAVAWGRATSGRADRANVWQRCAEILYCGKIYE